LTEYRLSFVQRLGRALVTHAKAIWIGLQQSQMSDTSKALNSDAASPSPVTVKRLFTHLLPRLATDKRVPVWPPDLFALCMSALHQSGAYCAVLKNWPPNGATGSQWADHVEQLGTSWLSDWPNIQVPDEVAGLWDNVLSVWDISVADLGLDKNLSVCQSLLQICAIADEACAGMGTPGTHYEEDEKPERIQTIEELFSYVDTILQRDRNGSTLCEEIDTGCLRVLPKMRTPQTGLTIRSLSHHLSLCSANEVRPKWTLVSYPHKEELALNLLLVPWPVRVAPIQFTPTRGLPQEMGNMEEEEFGFFTFTHDDSGGVGPDIESLMTNAKNLVGPIHGVVLPELALSPTQHSSMREKVLAQDSFLISGVGTCSEPGSKHGQNFISVDFPRYNQSLHQSKHHRWRLDYNQLSQYGLGSRLYPEKKWWEHIDVHNRELMFISMLPWLVVSVLICEDLSRPDPIGDLVRAVGPNLVIALLMDGPQLKQRWGARFASVLADDPGCSVLTLTSLGMCDLSWPIDDSVRRSRVIALWKDAENGAKEIELPNGTDGVVLSLSVRFKEEWAADGRSDHKNAGYPILSGIHPVSFASK
jgi:hypothetical protein